MFMNIEKAEFEISQGLQKLSSAISENEADSIARLFFPQLDTVIRSDQADKADQVANIALNYARSIFELKQQGNFVNESHIQGLRIIQNQALIDAHATVDKNAFKGIDYALGVLSKPPASISAQAQAETADGIDSPSETTAATDEASAAHVNKLKEFSTAFKPVFDHAAKIENEGERNEFLNNFFDLMEKGLLSDSPEQANSEGNSQTIAHAFKGSFNQESSPIDADNLKTAIQNLSAQDKEALKTYIIDLKDATINGGVGTLTSFAIEDHETQRLTAIALAKVKKNPLSRLTTGVDTETLQNQKAYVSAAVVALSRIAENQVRALEAQAIKPDKAQVFAEVFTKENLQKAILDLEGADEIFGARDSIAIEIYRDDIQPIASYLKNSKPKTEAQHENSVKHMLDNYGKVAFAVAPFLLAPLAAVLNKIPVVGRPVAGLINMFYGVFEKVGTPLMFALMGGEKSKQAPDDKSPRSAQEQVANKLQAA